MGVPMGLMRRVLLGALALFVLAFAVAFVAGPRIAEREIDRTLRSTRPMHAPLRHADLLGLALDDLVLHDSAGAIALRAKSIAVVPALAWPPIALELDGLTITTAGLAAFRSGVSWDASRNFTKRQFGNLSAMRIPVRIHEATLLGEATPAASGVLCFHDPQHAFLEAGPIALRVEATQDGATWELSTRQRTETFRVDAPGWEGFAR